MARWVFSIAVWMTPQFLTVYLQHMGLTGQERQRAVLTMCYPERSYIQDSTGMYRSPWRAESRRLPLSSFLLHLSQERTDDHIYIPRPKAWFLRDGQ